MRLWPFPCLLLLMMTAVRADSTDSVEDRLRLHHELPLRWDNVEEAPEWVYGEEPTFNLWHRLHEVELAPGEHTCVRIPAYELLRLYRASDELAVGDVDVALSTGSGLLAFTDTVPDEDKHSLLVDPRRPYVMLAHVFRPAHFNTPIRLGIFTSRHVPLREVAGYRDLINLEGEPVRLTTSVEADSLEFWEWEAGDQARLTAEGGARYLVETRYRYPPNESKLPQTYHLKVWDGDTNECLASLDYATSHETAHLVFSNGAVQVVSRVEPSFFEIPGDRSRNIVIETAGPVYVRVIRLEDPEYLAPMLNAPDPAPYEISEALRSGRFQCKPGSMEEERMSAIIDNPLVYPAELVERAAMRLHRDNGRTEGGMMATNLLLNAGAPRRDYTAIRNRWREFVGYRTYYRDSLPEGICLAALKRSYFPARRLQEIGKYREWLVMADSLIEASHNRLPLATFCPIQGSQNRTRHRLPDKSTYSIIRIAALRDRTVPADFWIRVDDEKPRRFRMVATPEMFWSQTKPSQAEAALTLIEGSTLDAPCTLRRDAEELAPTGYFEFLVPPRSRQIEVWNASNAYHLHVGVQYRTSDVFELSEDEYIHYVNKRGGQPEVFDILTQFLQGQADVYKVEKVVPTEAPEPGYGKQTPIVQPKVIEAVQDPCTRAEQELYNHWEPLRRYIISRYRQFVDSVASPDSMEPDETWLVKADALLDKGEYYLAERLVRYLYLYAEEDTIRQAAFGRLDRIARRHLDPEKLVLNACVRVIVESTTENVSTLCQLLREQGEKELALMLALSLPEGMTDTHEMRLACAFVKRWWEHFDRYLLQAPEDPNSRVWKGQRLWLLGHRGQAIDEFRAAEDHGREWLNHIERTHTARGKVLKGASQGLVEWAETERDHPGLKVWKQVSHQHTTSFRAGVTLRALEREKYFHAFIATPDEPLQLSFAGPQKLRIECRPIHPSASEDPLEGWIFIEGAAKSRKLPIITNYRSPGLEIMGRPNETPGTLIVDEFSISWNGRLKIHPQGCQILVRILTEAPEARSGHLPPLGYETAAWLFNRYDRPTFTNTDHHYREKMADEDVPAPHGSAVLVNHHHQLMPFVIDQPFDNPSKDEQRRLVQVMARLPSVKHTFDRPEHRQAIVRMHEWLWQREQGAAVAQRQAIAQSSADLFARLAFPELKRIHARIARETFWEPLLNASELAGLRETETLGWRPENPDLLARMQLIPSLGTREQLLSGMDSTLAMLTNREDNTTILHLENVFIPYLVPKPIRASVRLGEDEEQSFTLAPDQPATELTLKLPPGQTSLKVGVLQSEPNHFLKITLDAEKERELYERKTRRYHFVATEKEPVSARIDGPAWVRVDRHEADGEVQQTYHLLEEEVSTLTLPPSENGKESLYRIHVLRIDPEKPFHPPPYTERAVARVPAPLTVQPLAEEPVLAQFDDEFHLGLQEDGTWTLGLSYHSRRATEEDIFGAREPERFIQGDITHRYFNEDWRTYFRTTVLGRLRQYGGETFGIEHSAQHRPFDYPLNFTLTGSAFMQNGEWSLAGRASVSLTHEWSPKWSHTPSASLFFREMSLNDSGDFPEEIDQDVFTNYKADHRRGLRLRDEISYRPKRDTRLFTGASISTNQDFKIVQPDSFSYWAGINQLLGPLLFTAKFQGYRFFEDDDRAMASWKHRLRLEATANQWLINQHRVEAGIGYTRFIEEKENAFSIFLNWHFGEGRMWRDFRPGERPFYEVRRRRIPQDTNNALRLFYPQAKGFQHHPGGRGYGKGGK